MNITPEWISELNSDEIFVFGCRRSGRHYEGAANFARLHFGAIVGQGEGLQGQSYAIPTAGVGLREIRDAVNRFTEIAKTNPNLNFLVTPVGCGLGFWNVKDIAPLFREASRLPNVWLPKDFWNDLYNKQSTEIKINIRKIIALFIALILSICVFAQRQHTKVNEDTGESFEFTVNEGLKINACNEDWLDSFPNLMEHARKGETWAYENLGDCYRYGKGGVERSVFNALAYYTKAKIDVEELYEKAYIDNPHDDFGLLCHLMEAIDKKSMTTADVLDVLRNQPQPLPKSLRLLEYLLSEKETLADDPDSIISLIDASSSVDEFFVAFAYMFMIGNIHTPILDAPESDNIVRLILAMAEKAPILYNPLGKKYLQCFEKDHLETQLYLDKAWECFYMADKYGLLETYNATILAEYCIENNIDSLPPFLSEDITRLIGLYKDRLNESLLPIVEYEDNSVEYVVEE